MPYFVYRNSKQCIKQLLSLKSQVKFENFMFSLKTVVSPVSWNMFRRKFHNLFRELRASDVRHLLKKDARKSKPSDACNMIRHPRVKYTELIALVDRHTKNEA